MTYKRYLRGVFFLTLISLLFTSIAVVLWQSDKGLGFGDEGIYLLAARYPLEIQQNVSAIFKFTGIIFQIANYNPVLFRAFGLGIVLFSSLIFWIGFHSVAVNLYDEYNTRYGGVFSLLFIMIGSILHYQWSYLTPSYYTLTAVAVNVLSGLVLLNLACQRQIRRNLGILTGYFIGIVFGITLFFKFPTAIPLMFISIVLITLSISSRTKKEYFFAPVTIGFIVWLIFYFAVVDSPARAWDLFQEGWNLYQSLGFHNPLDKLIDYPNNIFVLLYTALYPFWFCYFLIIVSIISVKVNQSLSINIYLIWAVITVAVVLTLKDGIYVDVPERLQTYPLEGRTRFYLSTQLAWILLLGAIYISARYKNALNNIKDRDLLLLLSFLLILPIVGSLGTSNPIYNVIQFYAAPWFAAIFLLVISIATCSRIRLIIPVVTLTLGVHTTSNVIQGSLYQPAQIKPKSLFEQSIPTYVGNPPRLLKLDAETHNIVVTLSNAARAKGFKLGDDIIGFNEISGLVYALGGKSPGHPVFPCCSLQRDLYSKIALTFADEARLRNAFILLDVPVQDSIVSILTTAGIEFPKNYELITQVQGIGREFALYRPKQ